MDIKKPQKNPKKTNIFVCEYCHFGSVSKKDYTKHLSTSKHSNMSKDTEDIQITQKKPNTSFACECGNIYIHKSGLWRHKKKCTFIINDDNKIVNNIYPTTTIVNNTLVEVKNLTNMVMELMKSNNELQKQLVDVCKNSNSISNSNINSNNKTFNLQFFLNEQCKDAMNISEFVNTFELQLSDLESVGELGYVEGITKQIVDKLNSMDIYKRPMHCSDAKRETIYIKDDNKWEKEQRNNPKLRRAIKNLSFNNMKLIGKWSDTYPESKSSESYLNDKYMKLVKQTTGGNGDIMENEDRIIRRIVKEILIEKN
jgi:hypothetical protein